MDTSDVLVCVLMLVGIDVSISGTRSSHFKARKTLYILMPTPHSVARIYRKALNWKEEFCWISVIEFRWNSRFVNHHLITSYGKLSDVALHQTGDAWENILVALSLYMNQCGRNGDRSCGRKPFWRKLSNRKLLVVTMAYFKQVGVTLSRTCVSLFSANIESKF